MRLIDADRLKEVLERNFGRIGAADAMLQLIDAAPTIDAEPVRHGHVVWKRQIRGGYKYINVKCQNCGATEHVEIEHPLNTETPYCSECGKRLDDIFMECCPSCGTKMDGSEEHV